MVAKEGKQRSEERERMKRGRRAEGIGVRQVTDTCVYKRELVRWKRTKGKCEWASDHRVVSARLKDVVQEQLEREGKRGRRRAVESLRVVLRHAIEKVVANLEGDCTISRGIGAPMLAKLIVFSFFFWHGYPSRLIMSKWPDGYRPGSVVEPV